MEKALQFVTLALLLFFMGHSTHAHGWEIRGNQCTDGALTWNVQSYHTVNSYGIANLGITINGVLHPINQLLSGNIEGLSPTTIAQNSANNSPNNKLSYAVIQTLFFLSRLNIQPYSTNACWALLITGSESFTRPSPPASFHPITQFSTLYK